uniref:Uncharacterized protein orf101 n=1 Tax=Stigeoclonium helveticum TaxID=55999 RepID=Q06SJ1_STIHE|nr:hypothetical protein StheCp013 [Stigeoclonium helveticum]ABF60211.1 hypothetical protein [Stigeoclonium helveticum]
MKEKKRFEKGKKAELFFPFYPYFFFLLEKDYFFYQKEKIRAFPRKQSFRGNLGSEASEGTLIFFSYSFKTLSPKTFHQCSPGRRGLKPSSSGRNVSFFFSL